MVFEQQESKNVAGTIDNKRQNIVNLATNVKVKEQGGRFELGIILMELRYEGGLNQI